MRFDPASIPYSRCDSSFAVSRHPCPTKPGDASQGVWLRAAGPGGSDLTFRCEPLRCGTPVPFACHATPASVVLKPDGGGTVEICLAEPQRFLIRRRGCDLRLTLADDPRNRILREGDGIWVHAHVAMQGFRIRCRGGTVEPEQGAHPGVLCRSGDSECETVIDAHPAWAPPRPFGDSFDRAAAAVAASFARFADAFPAVPAEFGATARLAQYVDWSAIIPARGLLRRPAMLMSKNWMRNVWSWDHAFNALALAPAHPELAWDQMMIPFDAQDDSGALPDFINPDVELRNFLKPCVHAWLLALMEEAGFVPGEERLREAYDRFGRSVRFQLNHRDPDGSGLVQAWHGNDVWDNGTAFDGGMPIHCPYLTTFAIEQQDRLAVLAERLGRPVEATAWRAGADRCTAALLARLWRGGPRFLSASADGRSEPRSDSVLGCQMLLLGDRLPPDIRRALVAELRRHLTPWGVATEHPQSPLYEADGYWRGPIWAPTVFILVEGLRRSGEPGLAADIALRFCRTCARSGFAENFDALTGAPLCDPAYTWTSSVFLALASRYLDPAALSGPARSAS